MKLGLCMILKDEADQLSDCLGDIIDVFDDVVIIDNESTDGTRDILYCKFGIEPIPTESAGSRSELRNRGFARIRSDWILSLDADERIDRAELEALVTSVPPGNIHGYLTAWHTYRSDESPIEDYKLSIFRRDLRSCGLIHENIQPSVRDRSLSARWFDGITIRHYPDIKKDGVRRRCYPLLLEAGIRRDPSWIRYRWFLGYMQHQVGDDSSAIQHLEIASASHSLRFPVECLNAKMVLAAIHASRGARAKLQETLLGAQVFRRELADDFEVRVNVRLGPWIDHALECAGRGALSEIRAYDFAY